MSISPVWEQADWHLNQTINQYHLDHQTTYRGMLHNFTNLKIIMVYTATEHDI